MFDFDFFSVDVDLFEIHCQLYCLVLFYSYHERPDKLFSQHLSSLMMCFCSKSLLRSFSTLSCKVIGILRPYVLFAE